MFLPSLKIASVPPQPIFRARRPPTCHEDVPSPFAFPDRPGKVGRTFHPQYRDVSAIPSISCVYKLIRLHQLYLVPVTSPAKTTTLSAISYEKMIETFLVKPRLAIKYKPSVVHRDECNSSGALCRFACQCADHCRHTL